MGFEIKTESFEGPIELLLNLIEKRKLPISEISLAEITDDYIKFINSMEDQPFIIMTHFIFVASTLTLIKSKSLLPNLDLTEEENDDIENLKHRIEVFKVYIEISKTLKGIYSNTKKFHHSRMRKSDISFSPSKDFNLKVLQQSLSNVLNSVPKIENKKKEAYVRIAINIEEMMDSLSERIKNSIELDFNSFIKNKTNNLSSKKEIKAYNVVGFLAMLELVKNGVMRVLQDENFNDILMNHEK